jgi:ATP-binding dynein motor region
VLIAASFVSYCGPFNMAFREELVVQKWLKDLIDKKVPMTDGVMPLDQLTSDTEKAQWGNEGLPTDPLSIENGAIMMSSSRTTLMIDPQLQARATHKVCVDWLHACFMKSSSQTTLTIGPQLQACCLRLFA